ncbi:hypothetical protein M569_14851 [Genlisea aurea]|uniref:Uncharacterized protein n=1 Tax=Genlisea aurea TaxID=192259 RepID=S8BZG9_9LAMI|nr:hypothetical protein M569_14851 [Genlisea aurea]
MGTEVLRPYDVLSERFPASFHRRKHQIQSPGGNKKWSGKKTGSSPENGATKRSARNGSGARKDDGDGGLVSGKVTLLRRGESLDSLAKILHRSPDPKQPEPEPVVIPAKIHHLPNQIRLSPAPFRDVYAGSAFYSSPSPRSLPLPSFFNKRDPADSATQDLRRMLRLD